MKRRVHRIINGVLYDTSKAQYLHSVDVNFNRIKKNAYGSRAEVYIYKDGTIFTATLSYTNSTIDLPNEAAIRIIKEQINPEIYRKYFPLVVPGEDVKVSKKVSKKKELSRLSRIED